MNHMYGIQPQHLPRSMVKVARAPEGGPRLLTWVGRPGVRLLGFDEHVRYERATLQRFPQNRDGSIAWGEVSLDLVVRAEEDAEHTIRDFIRDDGNLVIMWGNLALPTVLLNPADAFPRVSVSEIMQAQSLFWMYRPGSLLERNYFEDTVTIAPIAPLP